MQIRRILAIVVLAAAPRMAVAQFTTFIPPQSKVADSVKAVVAAQEKAQADSTAAARITNMKVWVDSAAGVLPTPVTAADTAKSGIAMTASDSVTMANGALAPATASSLPLFVFAGAFLVLAGGALVIGAPPAKRRA